MDIEKTMQFILEMQARHEEFRAKNEIAIREGNERVARIERAMEANTIRIGQLVDVSLSLAHHGEETDRRMEETDRRIKELAAAQAEADARTNYKLNALIDTVDKIVRGNGKK
ncbi:MAG: hypothetical protein KGM47_15795 [Acidobacteriota bacterium]|nr:hypothetical protein [Acidobacteriota bacterium]